MSALANILIRVDKTVERKGNFKCQLSCSAKQLTETCRRLGSLPSIFFEFRHSPIIIV